MDWKFEKICIQYLTQGWNVKEDFTKNQGDKNYNLNITRLECKDDI